jgi:hypothetical protein
MTLRSAADCGSGAVEHWSCGEQRLCCQEALLHRQQISVMQHQLQRRQFHVGSPGSPHEHTTELRVSGYLGGINGKTLGEPL